MSDGATYTYVYNGSSLSQMNVGNDTLYFIYDASGTPTAVVYNGTTYYYQTNLQGDVIAILNGSGAKVVEYTYDDWGKVLSRTGSMASTLGSRNPLRYRGYVYDAETGLYYLQSRYYNPEIGRFINADAFPSTGQGFTGNNMFAYCGNNPVNLVDPTGELAFPGEIHNEVVRRIKERYNLNKEQTIIYRNGGRGRADLISSDGQVWDVKRDKPWHIGAGVNQVKKYTENIWFKHPDIQLKVGRDPIEADSFYHKSGLITYKVTYRDAGNGVIAYDYRVSDVDTKTATQIGMVAATAVATFAMVYFLSRVVPAFFAI